MSALTERLLALRDAFIRANAQGSFFSMNDRIAGVLMKDWAAIRDAAERIEFLESALDDAIAVAEIRMEEDYVCCSGGKFDPTWGHTAPQLAAYLREREGK